jgi:uncharacterized protein (DUF2141 family)
MLAAIYACANIGTPNGGPYDENPPRFVSSTPAINQINYKGKKVEIIFDELIQIEKPSENVIITPPQLEMPVIRASGRKATVELHDTLKENTTYTIDFTHSISDNNEKNALENFTFAFSTGDVIDSLEVSGYLLRASDLEPMPGITIGLHNNLEDSAFTSEAFVRTSRSNDKGRFTIRNIAPGTYRIYALQDMNRDYRFDQPGEEIAFSDSLIVPTFEFTSRQDTVWKDSLTVDTVMTVHYTRFMPDDIVLCLFKEDFERQFMQRPERAEENRFTLHFNAPLDTLISPVPLNFTPSDSSWYVAQWAEEKKSIHYWLTDSMLWKRDTLLIAVDYLKSDSLNVLRPQTDTLSLSIRRRPAAGSSRKKKDEPEPVVFLGMNSKATGSVNVFDTVSVVFDEPVLNMEKEWFTLHQKIDTLWTPVEFDFYPDSGNPLCFYIHRKWIYEEEFRLEVDSAVIYSIYGKWNNRFNNTFKIKKKDEYGNLYINISDVDTTAFAELLNSNDMPVRRAKVKDGGVLFMDLKPDKYYVRLIVDLNDNFQWDTGEYAEKRQPEEVYYYSKEITITQNWDIEESWSVKSLDITRQKPLSITKNKPKESTKKKRDYRDEGRQQSSSSGGNPMQNIGRPF